MTAVASVVVFGYSQRINNHTSMDDHKSQATVMPNAKDVEENKVIAAVGYLSILCLVPLLMKKNSPFAQFHGRQGFLLFVLGIALWMIGWFPVIGWILAPLGNLVIIILSIVGIVKAMQGEMWEIPYLGEYAKKIHF